VSEQQQVARTGADCSNSISRSIHMCLHAKRLHVLHQPVHRCPLRARRAINAKQAKQSLRNVLTHVDVLV